MQATTIGTAKRRLVPETISNPPAISDPNAALSLSAGRVSRSLPKQRTEETCKRTFRLAATCTNGYLRGHGTACRAAARDQSGLQAAGGDGRPARADGRARLRGRPHGPAERQRHLHGRQGQGARDARGRRCTTATASRSTSSCERWTSCTPSSKTSRSATRSTTSPATSSSSSRARRTPRRCRPRRTGLRARQVRGRRARALRMVPGGHAEQRADACARQAGPRRDGDRAQHEHGQEALGVSRCSGAIPSRSSSRTPVRILERGAQQVVDLQHARRRW